jgi:hypothetical protein
MRLQRDRTLAVTVLHALPPALETELNLRYWSGKVAVLGFIGRPGRHIVVRSGEWESSATPSGCYQLLGRVLCRFDVESISPCFRKGYAKDGAQFEGRR